MESMHMERLREITVAMKKHKIQIAFLQGSRWKESGSIWMNNYKCFSLNAGTVGTEIFTGVHVVIQQDLIEHSTTRVHEIVTGRALSVRIIDSKKDWTLIAAYAPGEHLDHGTKSDFWNKLKNYI